MKNSGNILFWVVIQLAISSVFAILVKFALQAGAEPVNFSVQILLVSGFWLSAALLMTEGRKGFAVNAREAFLLVAAGAVGAGLTFVFCLAGFRSSTTVNYVFLNQTSIVFVVVLSAAFLKERISIVKFSLLGCLLAGSYLVATGGAMMAPRSGDLLILLGNLTFSAGVVISKVLMRTMSELVFSAYRSLLGGFSILAIMVATGDFSPSASAAWVLPVGTLLAVAMYSMNAIVKKASASYMIMMSASSPVITAVLALYIFGESMNAHQFAGGAVIFASTVMIHYCETPGGA